MGGTCFHGDSGDTIKYIPCSLYTGMLQGFASAYSIVIVKISWGGGGVGCVKDRIQLQHIKPIIMLFFAIVLYALL